MECCNALTVAFSVQFIFSRLYFCVDTHSYTPIQISVECADPSLVMQWWKSCVCTLHWSWDRVVYHRLLHLTQRNWEMQIVFQEPCYV